jgi:taurine dioxygenase
MAHQVIFFRDQQMSVEQHKAFGRLFGDLLIHPAARAEVDGHPEIRVVHADEKTEVATGEVWHSDMSCEPEPPMGSILYLHQTPPVGGDTAFANMYLARSTPVPMSIRAAPTSAATRNSPRRCIPSCAATR